MCVCLNKNTWAYLKKSISYWKTKYQQCVGRIQSSSFITQVIQYDIACSSLLIAAKHKSGFIFTTDTPHGRALGVLWGISAHHCIIFQPVRWHWRIHQLFHVTTILFKTRFYTGRREIRASKILSCRGWPLPGANYITRAGEYTTVCSPYKTIDVGL